MVVLVHHADAVDPAVDSQRPLSATGREQAERVGRDLAARGLKPDVIWHSGKLRARQTAAAVWRACNPFAEMTSVRGLLPDDPPDWIRDSVTGETRTVVIVGHMPSLPRIAQSMIRGTPGSAYDFPLHGAVAFEAEQGSWVEMWRVTLTT
jgi:phosphohistidine phosphatase